MSLDSKINYVLEAAEDAKIKLDNLYEAEMISMGVYVNILDQVLEESAKAIQKLRTDDGRNNMLNGSLSKPTSCN